MKNTEEVLEGLDLLQLLTKEIFFVHIRLLLNLYSTATPVSEVILVQDVNDDRRRAYDARSQRLVCSAASSARAAPRDQSFSVLRWRS